MKKLVYKLKDLRVLSSKVKITPIKKIETKNLKEELYKIKYKYVIEKNRYHKTLDHTQDYIPSYLFKKFQKMDRQNLIN